MLKRRRVKVNRARFWVIAAMLFALAFLSLLVSTAPGGFKMEAGAAQQSAFYVEEAGAYDPPWIYVKATYRYDTMGIKHYRYDTVDTKDGDGYLGFFSVKVRGQCPEKWRLFSGSINIRGGFEWDKYRNRIRHVVDYWVDRSHRSIGPDHGQGWSDAFAFRLPFIEYLQPNPSPVDLCNAELGRAANDSARQKLLAEGFNFVLKDAFSAKLEIWCSDESRATLWTGPNEPNKSFISASTYLPLKVRCMPAVFTKGPPPREGKHLDFDPPIKSVEVVADPAVTEGRKCPVYVNFRGRITAGEKSQYQIFNTKYRVVGDHDYKSEWISVSLKRGETRTVNARRFIQQTDDPRGFRAPGGNLSSQDRQPSYKINDPRRIKAPKKTPVFHGWMMAEVMLSNDDVKQSAKTEFTVDCNPQPADKTIKSKP